MLELGAKETIAETNLVRISMNTNTVYNLG